MNCYRCRKPFHPDWTHRGLDKDSEGDWCVKFVRCPQCKDLCFNLERVTAAGEEEPVMLYPRPRFGSPVQAEVPDDFAEDYSEACVILGDSPKASAALSRRCLQKLIHDKAGINVDGHLLREIEKLLASGSLPSSIAETVDTVRRIGNFAAHPIKSERTGEILRVEPHEAEWLLETIYELFDFYFVHPKRREDRLADLDKKYPDRKKGPS